MAGKPRAKKCIVCGRYCQPEEILTINKKNYCSICGPKALEEYEAEQRRKKRETEAYKALMDYVYPMCEKNQACMAMMAKQVKDFKDKYGFKVTAILATLKYMYEYQENPPLFNPDVGIANVPFYYNQAENFFSRYWELKKKAEVEMVEPTMITIKRSDLNEADKKFWDKKREQEFGPDIDINEIPIEELDENENINADDEDVGSVDIFDL